MGHDATKCVMGSTQSSSKDGIESFESSPISFPAGLAVRRTNGNLLSVTKAHGGWIGVSLGASLSDTLKTSVLKAGLKVPVLLEAQPARGVVTIDTYANLVDGTDDTITIGATAFLAVAGSVTPTQATFAAQTSDEATAASLAAQINAHLVTAALVSAVAVGAVVTITAKANTSAGNLIALTYEQLGTGVGAVISEVEDNKLAGGGEAPDYVVIGNKVYFSDTTGKADDPNSLATISDAVYASEALTGIDESGTEVFAALVDMQGGL